MPDVSDDNLSRMYDFIESSNQKLNSWNAITRLFKDFSKRWSPRQMTTVLDLGCGRGDFTCHLADWAKSQKLDMNILGVDRYGRQIQMAKDRHSVRRDVNFDVKDISDPFFNQAQQFDYVISTFDLHHVDPALLASHLKIMDRLAKRGVLIFDLLRDSRGLALMWSLAKLWGDPVVQHDAPHLVRRSMTMKELRQLVKQSGLEYATFRTHFGFRYSISGERRYVMEEKFGAAPRLAGT